MAEYLAPAVYVEETSFRSKSIEGVGTSTTAFVGLTARGLASVASAHTSYITPPLLTSFADFETYYGGVDNLVIGGNSTPNYLAHAANAFFANGGARLFVSRVLGAGAVAATSGVLNSPAGPANKQITFTARYPGGAQLAGPSTANFVVQLNQTSLASTKQLALRLPTGTMVQIGTDYYVLGPAPMVTSASDASAFTGLADSGALNIISLSAIISDPSGPVAEYAGLGFDARHPRYAGLVLGATPPTTGDALTNPVQLNIGAAATAIDLRNVLFGANTQATVNLSGGADGTGAPSTTDYQFALNRLLGLEEISIVAAPGASSFAAPTPAAVNQMLIGHAETRRAYRIAVLDTPASLEVVDVMNLKSQID
jgi:hypothetical protein